MSARQKQILLGVFLVIILALAVFAVVNRNLFIRPAAPVASAPGDTQPIIDAFNANDFAGAIAGANAQLAADPNNIQALLLKAGTLAQQGSLTFNEREYALQAIDIAHQVLALDPKNDEAWRIIGYANEIMQNYSEAHAAYNQSLIFNPHNALTLFDNGHAWDLQGQADKAEAGYRAAIAVNPNLDMAHIGLGRILIRKNDLPAATREFQQALSLTSNTRTKAEILSSLGSIQMSTDLSAAQKYFQQATVADPHYPNGWAGLGTVIFDQALTAGTPPATQASLIQTSLNNLDTAIKLNPNLSSAHIQFAIEFAVIGQVSDAIGILNKTKRIVPNDITLSASDKAATLQQIDTLEASFTVALSKK